MKQLIIDRKKWLHGEGSARSFLLREEDGKMCCLGFYALSKGYSKEEILGKQSPAALIDCDLKFNKLVSINNYGASRFTSSAICYELFWSNDSTTIKDSTLREQSIIDNFYKIGVEVKFEGEY